MGFLSSIAGSVVGGLFGKSSSKDAADAQSDANEANLEFQRNLISTRVADAKKAGIHPLYSLGVQPTGNIVQPVTDGSWKRDMGQNIGSSISNYETFQSNRKTTELQQNLLRAQSQETKARAVATRVKAMNEAKKNFVGLSKQASDKRMITDTVNGLRPRKIPTPWGNINPDRKVVPAQVMDDQYDGLIASLYGLGLLGHDLAPETKIPNAIKKSINRNKKSYREKTDPWSRLGRWYNLKKRAIKSNMRWTRKQYRKKYGY